MVEISRKLLEELAPENPINQDESGGCVWCGAILLVTVMVMPG